MLLYCNSYVWCFTGDWVYIRGNYTLHLYLFVKCWERLKIHENSYLLRKLACKIIRENINVLILIYYFNFIIARDMRSKFSYMGSEYISGCISLTFENWEMFTTSHGLYEDRSSCVSSIYVTHLSKYRIDLHFYQQYMIDWITILI